jgi:hypothetical protein
MTIQSVAIYCSAHCHLPLLFAIRIANFRHVTWRAARDILAPRLRPRLGIIIAFPIKFPTAHSNVNADNPPPTHSPHLTPQIPTSSLLYIIIAALCFRIADRPTSSAFVHFPPTPQTGRQVWQTPASDSRRNKHKHLTQTPNAATRKA